MTQGIFLLVLLYAFLLAGVVIRALQIDQNTLSNSKDKTLFYLPYKNNGNVINEERICLFDSYANSVEQIANFTNDLSSWDVATTKDKILGIDSYNKRFEIFDLDTRQISRGPYPPEWRIGAFVAYFKGKLYYLGGRDLKASIWQNTNRVDVLIDGKWQTGPTFSHSIGFAQTIICDEILYVICGWNNKKIYRLSDDEREWSEIGEIPEIRGLFGVASLNRRIYITGGVKGWNDGIFKSCLCFDPSAPVDSRISQIADMNYERYRHSLIVANEKLYAIGGFQKLGFEDSCNSIEEYDPQTNKWREVGEINIK